MSAWLVYALVTTLLWGVWGALAGLPGEHGVPETLNYVVWSLTMIPPAVFVLRRSGEALKRDRRSVMLGLAIGLLGAGGQLILFYAVRVGPPYLIFPIISLSPALTIALSMALLGERTGKMGALGIALALLSLPLFDYRSDEGTTGYGLWFFLALGILAAWGVQAYVIKLANQTMDAASIFFYMMLSGLMLVPVALAMTDFSQPINYGLDGPGLAAAIQILNAIGALTLVFAFRYGKAIIVAPLINAGAPLLTAVLSMLLLSVVPGPDEAGGNRAVPARRPAARAAARIRGAGRAAVKALLDIVARHKRGEATGIWSLCSAHPAVIASAMKEALRRRPVAARRGDLEPGQPVRRLHGHAPRRLRALPAQHRGEARLSRQRASGSAATISGPMPGAASRPRRRWRKPPISSAITSPQASARFTSIARWPARAIRIRCPKKSSPRARRHSAPARKRAGARRAARRRFT